MRVMINVHGADGHFLPMVPLARALQAEDHEVVFLTPSTYRPAVEHRGFAALGVEATLEATEDRKAAIREMEGIDRLRYTMEYFLQQSVVHCLGLVEVAGQDKPDVAIRETTAYGAWMAGELLDFPVVSFDFAPAPTGVLASLVGDLFQNARAEVCLPPDDELASLDRWLTILGAPPNWFPPECFRPTTHLFQPPEDPPDGGSLPDWFSALPDQANLYVTLGTTFNQTPGVFEMVFEAVEGLDANVIVTVGQTMDPAAFGPLPRHIRVERFIPQGLVLPHCDAMIAHGGYGSLMGALRHGLPVVTLPLAAADNHLNAARVEQLGAGIAVNEDDRSAERIREAARAILEQPGYRSAARMVAAGMAELPPLTDAVGLIERLARERQPLLAG